MGLINFNYSLVAILANSDRLARQCQRQSTGSYVIFFIVFDCLVGMNNASRIAISIFIASNSYLSVLYMARLAIGSLVSRLGFHLICHFIEH